MKIMDKMAYQSSLNDILDKIIDDYKIYFIPQNVLIDFILLMK